MGVNSIIKAFQATWSVLLSTIKYARLSDAENEYKTKKEGNASGCRATTPGLSGFTLLCLLLSAY